MIRDKASEKHLFDRVKVYIQYFRNFFVDNN